MISVPQTKNQNYEYTRKSQRPRRENVSQLMFLKAFQLKRWRPYSFYSLLLAFWFCSSYLNVSRAMIQDKMEWENLKFQYTQAAHNDELAERKKITMKS